MSRPDATFDEFAIDVLAGLTSKPKVLSSRWFYDDKGSELFAKIMDTEAYYPTRVEWQILRDRGPQLLALPFREVDVVDLGAGDGRKSETIMHALQRAGVSVRYVPIDISGGALSVLAERMRRSVPGVEIHPIEADFMAGLRILRAQSERPRLALFLGSNIGNFTGAGARAFLRRIWGELAHNDRMLIGFDLKKDVATLLRAYNDPEGYTAEFNLNLLDRINRELDGDFDRRAFMHYGTYNAVTGAMESYLLSTRAQQVQIGALKLKVSFEPFEPIRTECSCKYLPGEALALGRDAGFVEERSATDELGWFLSSLWRVDKA